MGTEYRHEVEAAIERRLRASGEPVREAFLYERVRADGVAVSPEDFVAVLVRLEVEGHVRIDPVHDEVRDPEPFAPRFWRIID
ncbi:MAG: hypothetical protein FJW92_07770 [Actinobacteria bacterium]|nr:hypothetical protein [Actinomycetota bacterium]